MTPMQRHACHSLRGLAFGRQLGYHSFARSMVRLAGLPAWPAIDLSPRQVRRLAICVRKFRRQIADPHLLFWSQRALAELATITQEEPCPQ